MIDPETNWGVTVTGGKLTSFRNLADDALKAAEPCVTASMTFDGRVPVLAPVESHRKRLQPIADTRWLALFGRYGRAAGHLVAATTFATAAFTPQMRIHWAEIVHGTGHEQARRPFDLLLRRVRLGLLTAEGGRVHLDRIRPLCSPVLTWDATRWKREVCD